MYGHLNASKNKMDIKTLFRDTSKIAKIATIIIFLALVRSISEPFRLQYYSKTMLTYDEH